MSRKSKHIFYKQLLLSVALFFLFMGFSHAQLWRPQGGDSAKRLRFEAGLAAYSFYVNDPGFANRIENFSRGHYFLNGIYARLNHRGNAFRIGFHHFEDAQNFPKGTYNGNIGVFQEIPMVTVGFVEASARKMISAQMGYQVQVTNTKLSPYFFADLLFQNANEWLFIQKEVVRNGFVSYEYEVLEANSKRFGLSAGVGLRLQINSFLTASFETQLQGYYANNTGNLKTALLKNGTKLSFFPAQFMLGFYL